MNSGCIQWKGSIDKGGYGLFCKRLDGDTKRRVYKAHRWAYEKFYGPIPAGMWVLHNCDNPPCINPGHLWLGTAKDNIQDMVRKGRQKEQRKTHCDYGHPLSGENLTYRQGKRFCRECGRRRNREWLSVPEQHEKSLANVRRWRVRPENQERQREYVIRRKERRCHPTPKNS